MFHAIAHLAATTPNPLNGGAPAGAQPSDWFWSSAIGIVVWSLLSAAGIIIVLMTATKALKTLSGGKVGEGARIIVIGLVLAAFCFYPPLINQTIQIFVQFVQAVLDSVGKLFGGGSGGGGVTTTT